MTALRIVIEGVVRDHPLVIEGLEVERAPFAGEALRLSADDGSSEVEGVFRVDRVGWGPAGDATAFVRPEA